MAQANVFRVQMIPAPIQPGQFTKGFILFADIPPGIIADIGQSRADGAANLYRQVHLHIRHGIGLVGGNNDSDFFQVFLTSSETDAISFGKTLRQNNCIVIHR